MEYKQNPAVEMIFPFQMLLIFKIYYALLQGAYGLLMYTTMHA